MAYALFVARTYFEGYELWITDGTKDGTRLLKEYSVDDSMDATYNDTSFANFLVVGSSAYVMARGAKDNAISIDVVDSNGRLTSVVPASAGYSQGTDVWARYGSSIYFGAAKTTPEEIDSGVFQLSLNSKQITQVDDYNGSLTFPINGRPYLLKPGANGDTIEFFKLSPDGEKVKAFEYSSHEFGFPYSTDLYGTAGDKIVFQAYDRLHGTELWVSDGTAKGTKLLKDVFGGVLSGIQFDFRSFFDWKAKGLSFFQAKDGKHGVELWVTDGTSAGTHMVKDVGPGLADARIRPDTMRLWNNKVVFTTVPEFAQGERHLWTTDGTAAGTHQLAFSYKGKELHLGINFSGGIGVGTKFFFEAGERDPGTGYILDTALYSYDAATKKVSLVANTFKTGVATNEVGARDKNDDISEMSRFGKGFLFQARSDNSKGDVDVELWYSDGTAEGTAKVKDIYPGFGGPSGAALSGDSSYPRQIMAFGDPRSTGLDDTIRLTSAKGDTVDGQRGDDTIFGGPGKDTLTGGKGDDTFVFDTVLKSANADTITDFKHKHDKIWLDDDVFARAGHVPKLDQNGRIGLDKKAFWASADGTAHAEADRIIYDNSNGHLLYDADGSKDGKAVLFAILDAHLTLDAGDFLLIA